jgi:hypothetical protein
MFYILSCKFDQPHGNPWTEFDHLLSQASSDLDELQAADINLNIAQQLYWATVR